MSNIKDIIKEIIEEFTSIEKLKGFIQTNLKNERYITFKEKEFGEVLAETITQAIEKAFKEVMVEEQHQENSYPQHTFRKEYEDRGYNQLRDKIQAKMDKFLNKQPPEAE